MARGMREASGDRGEGGEVGRAGRYSLSAASWLLSWWPLPSMKGA